jgi:hypothetical protein
MQKISEFACFSQYFAGKSGDVNKPEWKTGSKNVSILQIWLQFPEGLDVFGSAQRPQCATTVHKLPTARCSLRCIFL